MMQRPGSLAPSCAVFLCTLFFPGVVMAQAGSSSSQSSPTQVAAALPPRAIPVAELPTADLPDAPLPVQSASPQQPSLADLGFSTAQTQADPKLQARLNKRSEMLKIHQRLGVITLAPLVANLITGPMVKAKGKNGQVITEPSTANLDFHAAVGGAAAGLYFTTASFAIFAPKIPNNPKHGAIRVHEALAFIHGPGMILTPILGSMAFSQEQNGEKVHGIAAAHGAVAATTVIAYAAAIVAVSWPIHLKFWRKP